MSKEIDMSRRFAASATFGAATGRVDLVHQIDTLTSRLADTVTSSGFKPLWNTTFIDTEGFTTESMNVSRSVVVSHHLRTITVTLVGVPA